MGTRTGVIMAGLGLLIAVVGFVFYDAAGAVVTPGDVLWGLGRLFTDIDRSDIRLLQMAGLVGVAIGGVLPGGWARTAGEVATAGPFLLHCCEPPGRCIRHTRPETGSYVGGRLV